MPQSAPHARSNVQLAPSFALIFAASAGVCVTTVVGVVRGGVTVAIPVAIGTVEPVALGVAEAVALGDVVGAAVAVLAVAVPVAAGWVVESGQPARREAKTSGIAKRPKAFIAPG